MKKRLARIASLIAAWCVVSYLIVGCVLLSGALGATVLALVGTGVYCTMRQTILRLFPTQPREVGSRLE